MAYGPKLFLLINRMMSLGLKHPTEHTMTQIMSILHLAGKDENEVSSVKPMVFYKSLSDFKALLKSTRKTTTQCPNLPTTSRYPQTPEDMKASCPELYATAYPLAETDEGEKPIPSRISEGSLEQLRISMPARNTHIPFDVAE